MIEDVIDPDEREEQRAKTIREEQITEALDRESEVVQLGQLLGDEAMRDFAWRLLAKCNVFAGTYSKVFSDMAFQEGKRNIGLWLLSEIAEANPDALLTMQTKANRIAAQAARVKRRKTLQARRG